MSLFSEPMRWVTRVAAAILLANVRNQRLRVFSLDLKRGTERIFCVYSDVVRLTFKFQPNGKLHWLRLPIHPLGLPSLGVERGFISFPAPRVLVPIARGLRWFQT